MFHILVHEMESNETCICLTSNRHYRVREWIHDAIGSCVSCRYHFRTVFIIVAEIEDFLFLNFQANVPFISREIVDENISLSHLV
jgi:hypothetical protein